MCGKPRHVGVSRARQSRVLAGFDGFSNTITHSGENVKRKK